MRICIVYDHLYPQTIGGAERWLRDLALRLEEAGHEVTYLTMRHWDATNAPSLPGVRVIGVVHAGDVYSGERRTLGPPLRFGIGVARHLLRHGGEYDVVHAASFPYFSLAAVALARRRGYRLVIEWHEVWTRNYWRRYAGPVVGTIGWLVQRACIRIPHEAYCFSQLTTRRLLGEGYRGDPVVLPGIYGGSPAERSLNGVDPALVVYAGRHIREKRLDALLDGLRWARERRPDLHLDVYGDGPDRPRIESLAADLRLRQSVRFLGRRPEQEVANAFARAACLATASEREGYGLVVVEAAAQGTPSVIVAGPENAATELVRENINGAIAADASPDQIGAALLRVVDAGPVLRTSTSQWFDQTAETLRLDRSLDIVLRSYAS